jgi:hypothetical protein
VYSLTPYTAGASIENCWFEEVPTVEKVATSAPPVAVNNTNNTRLRVEIIIFMIFV